MESKNVSLKFTSNNKILEIGKNTNIKLISIEGLESSDYELSIAYNAQYAGGVVTNKRVLPRPISIVAESTSNKNLGELRKNIISFFNFLETGTLYVNYLGTNRRIDYDIEKFDILSKNINEPLNFTVDLICVNPFLTEASESKVDIALWKGKFRFPLVIPSGIGMVIGLREPSLIANVNNAGDVTVGMKIKFKAKGSLKNPSILNVNTREYIKVKKSMVAGEEIIINTNNNQKKVTQILNGTEKNILNYIDHRSKFLQLSLGDNLFRYDAEENIENLEMSIYFSLNYLGV